MLQTAPKDLNPSTLPLVGVIDVGSNSIRLVIFEDDARSPDYFFNEKTICRLGEGLSATGKLNPRGKERALAALQRFVGIARGMGVRELIGVGTAAMREAADAPAFRDEIARETGLEIRVATGLEEARLSSCGVMLGWPNAQGLIADIGGSSLELAKVEDGEILGAVSTNAGHLRLADASIDESASILEQLRDEASKFAPIKGPLVLIGGAWRALAKAEMSRQKYPLNVLMGYEVSPDAIRALCEWAISVDPQQLKKAAGASSSRVASIAAGARALGCLMDALKPENVAVSAFGLREGLIFDRMPKAQRCEDPLLAAALAMEVRSARSPGFGQEVYDWLSPIISGFPADQQRLALATCHLHDVNWRQHPDFRAAACFTTVTRANLSGLGHGGRIFIGAALLHRYKTTELGADVSASLKLLPDEKRNSAEALGRALRLGAMLTGSVKGMLNKTRIEIADGELALILEPSVAHLAGERVERRLNALGDCLGLASRMIA